MLAQILCGKKNPAPSRLNQPVVGQLKKKGRIEIQPDFKIQYPMKNRLDSNQIRAKAISRLDSPGTPCFPSHHGNFFIIFGLIKMIKEPPGAQLAFSSFRNPEHAMHRTFHMHAATHASFLSLI